MSRADAALCCHHSGVRQGETCTQVVGIHWGERLRKGSHQDQGARKGLDGEVASDRLDRVGLPLERSAGALLAQPLHLGLAPVDLAGLAQIGAFRREVLEGERVSLSLAGNFEPSSQVEQTRERGARLDLQASSRRHALGAEDSGLLIRGPGVDGEGSRPGDRL